MEQKSSQLPELLLTEISRFSEWRGTVKEAIKHLAAASEQKDKQVDLIWENLDKIRTEAKICRERCDNISAKKLDKADSTEFKSDIKDLKNSVNTQEKAQIELKITNVFYGIIGGALFTILLYIGNLVLKSFKG